MSDATSSPKKKYQYFFSPKGTSVYPKLITADYKFKKEFGEFSTKLSHKLTQKGVQELIKAIDAEAEKSVEAMAKEVEGKKDKRGKAVAAFLCEDLPYFINEEDGTATFSYKMSASYTDKKSGLLVKKRPNLFDANGTPIKDFAKLNIGGGSELIVNFYFQHWFTEKLGAGVRLNMSDVQIVTLKEFTRDPGFARQEGGFVNAPDTSGNDAADDQDATPDSEGTDAGSPDPENF
jgi:hypothetical protein